MSEPTPKFKGGNELERLRRDNTELRKAVGALEANRTALVEQSNNLVIAVCALQIAQERLSRAIVPIHMNNAMESIADALATAPTAETPAETDTETEKV